MISIIVIEYNSLEEIQQCINSVQKYCNDVEYELIVSSNSCYSINKQNEIMTKYSNAKWIFNKTNGGFAYGMNRGLEKAKGDYLVIMNPDVVINGSLSMLTSFLDNHKEVGAIAPQILGNNNEIQDSCGGYLTPWNFFIRQLKRIITKKTNILYSGIDYTKTQTVNRVIGAFIMITKEVYKKVGGLDESYFLYVEDFDWCTQIAKANYKIVYYPKLQIIYEGTRSARVSSKYAKIFLNSLFHYWKKNYFFFGYPKTKKTIYD